MGGGLASVGRRVFALSQQAAWRGRDDWQRVLPVAGAEQLVDCPWDGAVVSPATGQPSTMLRPEFAVIPNLFRADHLAEVDVWCAGPERLSIRHVDAAGGTGKTRFAVQACLAARQRGWVAGLLPVADRGADALGVPRLLVVDYVEERDAVALALRLAGLQRSASVMAPVRMLLLARPAAGTLAGQVLAPLKEAASGATLTVLDEAVDTSSAAGELTIEQRGELFTQAVAAFGRTWHGDAWTPAPVPGVDLSGRRYARPLDVLFEAFDVALSGPDWQASNLPPVDRALDHEARHWKAQMPGVDARLLRGCVALATLAGARDDEEARALFELLCELTGEPAAQARGQLHSWLRALYDGPDVWNPLRPDRLGEALVARVLDDQDDHGQALSWRPAGARV